MEDTIAAISTPVGEGGIAIIRVSGPRAFEIADALFVSRRGKVAEFPSHTIHFGTIGKNGDLVDQVMLAVMRAPHTYTTEDVVEINCHGGLLTARKLLSLCLQKGARLAEPGEFTKRAFLNGRIDLTQAEAVMDLIHARTDRAHSAATNALEGHLARKIADAREKILAVLAHIEAYIDFPDEDITPDSLEKIRAQTAEVIKFLQALLETAAEGKILREGIIVAIVGRPNVGKSSLMNALLGYDRSIVTSVPGTTRDIIEDFASIRGIPVRLCDTAGLRKARGKVEEIGVGRSHNALLTSDLVIHVSDASKPFATTEWDLAKRYKGKPSVLVLNKIDLPRKAKVLGDFPVSATVETSATAGLGLDILRDRILDICGTSKLGSSKTDVAINERQADALRRATKNLTDAYTLIESTSSPELISQPMRSALNALGEIVGKTSTEDILDKIFSTFCIGK